MRVSESDGVSEQELESERASDNEQVRDLIEEVNESERGRQ